MILSIIFVTLICLYTLFAAYVITSVILKDISRPNEGRKER